MSEYLKRVRIWGTNSRLALSTSCYAFFLTLFTLLVVYAFLGLFPFGDGSLAYSDGAIQYIDFLTWGKKVYGGVASVGFDFSSYMGADTTATFAYYLASPFSFLLLWIPESLIASAINLIALCKLSFAAFTMSFFLTKRFEITKKSVPLAVFLGVSYSLCQWGIVQSTCIMWLDAFYIAPLVMLALYYLISKKTCWFYSCMSAFALISNWYMGSILCLFSIFWFFFECILYFLQNNKKEHRNIKIFLFACVRFFVSGVIGILLSLFLLLPTFYLLEASARGSANVSFFGNLLFGRNPFSCISNYTIGATSSFVTAALFTGSLPYIGAIGAIFASRFTWKCKVTLASFIVLGILIICWSPLVSVFCLFQKEETYLIRYSFIFSLILVFVSAYFYLDKKSGFGEKEVMKKLCIGVFALVGLSLLFFIFMQKLVTGKFWITFICILFMLLLVCLFHKKRKVCILLMCILCAFEGGSNAYFILSNDNHVLDLISSRRAYEEAEQNMLAEINARGDLQPYRIYTTRPWDDPDKNPSFATNQNEPLAFSFNSMTGYSSIANKNQLDFLAHMGENRAHVIASTKQPLLPLAALLSAKYIISSENISVLQNTGIIGPYQQRVYQNQYAFPFMFSFDETEDFTFDTSNPFVYNNEVYSFLFGTGEEVFKEASVQIITKTPQKTEYEISLSNDSNLLYALIPNFTGEILLNDKHYLDVKKDWVSTKVFYIPVPQDETQVKLTIIPQDSNEEATPVFQECQMNVLRSDSDLAKRNAATIESFSNSEIHASIMCSHEKNLFVSMPVSNGWKIYVNNKEITPQQVFDCFYSIPVEEGINSVVLIYTTPGLLKGRCLTALGVVGLVGEFLYERKKRCFGVTNKLPGLK